MTRCWNSPAVVIDNGTGYTKMGFAGNSSPQFVIPSVVATKSASLNLSGNKISAKSGSSMEDLDLLIGDEALAAAKYYSLGYPIRHGQIENWDWMEAFWSQSIFRYLRCNPEDHFFLLTEPPLNTPENREYTAEIMFETFNVPGLYIAVQAVLALAASWSSSKTTSNNPLTGTVIDSGDGVTHIIPVVDGYAICSAIKHVPIAGKNITHFIQQLLRDRIDLSLPPEDSLDIARCIKESSSYVSPDIAKEFSKLNPSSTDDLDPIIKPFTWTDPISHRSVSFDIGPERFLGPEIFFSPEMSNSDFVTPLPNLVDQVIQTSPIDCRRSLYKNIVLSGGSTMFRGFSKRLQRDMRTIVEERLAYATMMDPVNKSSSVLVNVITHENQRFAVWNGGSLFASMDQFPAFCNTKADYDEYGSNIVRQSRVFSNLLG